MNDTTHEYIPAESQAPDDEIKQKKPVKDTATKKPTKIGEPAPVDEKKKKGFFKKIFGKKEEETTNDY
jgi:hypothetical protein